MKNAIFLLSLLFILTNRTNAQWSSDPLNPLVICDAIGNQEKIQTVPDGEGGIFCFWLDSRTSNETTQVYGQHFDSNGNILWSPNGKLILEGLGDIRNFKLYHYDDDDQLIIVWFNYGATVLSDNKLCVQQIDDNGNKMWVDDLEISHANTTESPVVWYFNDFDLVKDDYGFHIGFLFANGGGYQYNLSRFTYDGFRTTPLHGVFYGSNFNALIRMVSDQNNGVFLFGPTGNGAGAPLRCAHLDTLATPYNNVWPGWMVVSDAPGLSYEYDAVADPGGITFVWEGSNTIKANRVDTSGAFGWDIQPKILCSADGGEIDFVLKQNINDYFVIWKDSRAGIVGNHAIYGQRFNLNGELLWGETGAEIANMSTFDPFTKFTFDEFDNLVVCHLTSLGMRKHVISSSGVQVIGGNGEDALTGAIQPNAGEFELLRIGNHIILSGMRYNFNDTNVFLSCIDGCSITSIVETATSCGEYTYNGVTYSESGSYEIELPGDTLITLNLTITNPVALVSLQGDTLISELNSGNLSWLNCNSQTIVSEGIDYFIPDTTGDYALILELNGCTDTSDCVNLVVNGLNNLINDLDIDLFPNPSSGVISITSATYLQNTSVLVFNYAGQLVLNPIQMSGNSLTIYAEELPSGVYQIVLFNGNRLAQKRWMKN